MSSLAAQPSWLLRPTLSKLAGTPKGSGSDDKKYTALVRKGGGDSTDVISRFGPYWPTVSELAQIGDLFTQAKPCRESWKRGSNSKNLKEADSTLRSSQAVPHPSTNRALCRLTSEVERDPVHSTRYGRQRKCITALDGVCTARERARGAATACCSTMPQPLAARRGLVARLRRGRTNRRGWSKKLTAPEGLPRQSPTLVLTGHCAA